MSLSPTLWRTCRVLSGATRLSLLRRILQAPGLSVSQLAAAEGISRPRASQELRRLQSRGLVGVERTGRWVLYLDRTDPLVPSAKPLLQAMRDQCAQGALAPSDGQVARLAQGLAHGKRIELVRVLRGEALDLPGLSARLKMPPATLCHHLKFLEDGGWIVRAGPRWKMVRPRLPLMKSLLKLI